jgi:ABC-type branched-subunit amino acid transport system substrate-binding protein
MALVLIAGPEDGVRALRSIRERDFQGRIFGSPQLARRTCLEPAGPAARGIRVPVLAHPPAASAERRDFEARFRDLTGRSPDWAASHTYDAARILLAALDEAGLSRVGIREALLDLSPWQGVTGVIEWDPTGQNRRPVTAMGTIRDGQLVVE